MAIVTPRKTFDKDPVEEPAGKVLSNGKEIVVVQDTPDLTDMVATPTVLLDKYRSQIAALEAEIDALKNQLECHPGTKLVKVFDVEYLSKLGPYFKLVEYDYNTKWDEDNGIWTYHRTKPRRVSVGVISGYCQGDSVLRFKPVTIKHRTEREMVAAEQEIEVTIRQFMMGLSTLTACRIVEDVFMDNKEAQDDQN